MRKGLSKKAVRRHLNILDDMRPRQETWRQVGDVTYATFQELSDAFLGGDISEASCESDVLSLSRGCASDCSKGQAPRTLGI